MPQTRRILVISGSYYVSLPKSWIEINKLGKGDAVLLQITDEGALEIFPLPTLGETRLRSIEVEADEYVGRRIISAYLNGYDIIEVFSMKKIEEPLRKIIRKTASFLVGLEIVEETATRIILQCFSDTAVDPWPVIRRMSEVASSMYVDAVIALTSGNYDLAESVSKRDDGVDKLYFFTVRIIRSSMLSIRSVLRDRRVTPLQLLDYRLMSKALEEIADYGEDLGYKALEILEKGKCNNIDDLVKVVGLLRSSQRTILSSYRSGEVRRVVEAFKKLEEANLLLERYTDRPGLPQQIAEMITDLRHIAKIIGDLADLVF